MSTSSILTPPQGNAPIGFLPFSPLPSRAQWVAGGNALILQAYTRLSHAQMTNPAGNPTLVVMAPAPLATETLFPLALFGHADLVLGGYFAGQNILIRWQGAATDLINDGGSLIDAQAKHHFEVKMAALATAPATNIGKGKALELTLAGANYTGGNVANYADVFLFYTKITG